KYKARIKILVHETGLDDIRAQVEREFEVTRSTVAGPDAATLQRIEASFVPPQFADLPARSADLDLAIATDEALRRFALHNVSPHAQPGYAIVTVSLKPHGGIPGDASSEQMRALADLAERYSCDELRVSHEQNIILPHVRKDDLPAVFAALQAAELATANADLISDIIACPGLDYCALATARSIPIAQDISNRFNDPEREADIGELKIKISGCINACGHHHVGHIGILGLDKAGKENYQLTLGGDHTETAAIGERLGPGLDAEEVAPAIERIVEAYRAARTDPQETFLQTYRRVGQAPFKAAVYEAA
ncbi:MAG: nitrite/sulfite reductase, partial [Pseudomonadota bacterium]